MAPTEFTVPIFIVLPGHAKITITGQSIALFKQRVTVRDLDHRERSRYGFSGSGEKVPMHIDGQLVDGTVTFESVSRAHRTLSVFCEHLNPRHTVYESSRVRPPRTWTEVARDGYVKRILWEIDSEDWKNDDFNDSVITIVADLEEDEDEYSE